MQQRTGRDRWGPLESKRLFFLTYPVRRRMTVGGVRTERSGTRPAPYKGGTAGGDVQRVGTGQIALRPQLLKDWHQFGQMFIGWKWRRRGGRIDNGG